MTTPQFDYGTTAPADLPENVVHPSALGEVLQDTSSESYQAEAAARFPGALDGTLAGGPLASGPLGIVTRMATQLQANVANADPATIRKPRDLQSLVPGFFSLDLGSGIFGGLLQALQGVGSGVLGGVLGSIADFFSGQWGKVDHHEAVLDSFGPGDLRDLADGQAALIGQIESLEENPGTCTLTMSHNATVGGYANQWLPMPFDTDVAASKNAEHEAPAVWEPTYRHKIRLLAPGAWNVRAFLTFHVVTTGRQYFEIELVVMREFARKLGAIINTGAEEYSVARFSNESNSLDWKSWTPAMNVQIPDFDPGAVPVDEAKVSTGFYAFVRVRFRDATAWNVIGGIRRSAFSVDRKSIDVGNYAPPADGVGTIELEP